MIKFIKTNTRRIQRNTTRRDIIFLVLCVGVVLSIALLITRGRYIYGNQVDWLSQHSVLPDYFRRTFYESGDLFPEFNFNLGAGQNAYNIAYYGYLSPIILISYFLPFIAMENYIIISSIAVIIISAILMFYWLKFQEGLTTKEVYFGTMLLVCCAPMIYHSHMQIMFMNYMPFLLMSFIGIDLMYKDNNRRFLTINIALMFLTSYFFAFAAMFSLSIYAIYKYLDKSEMLWKRVKDYSMSCIVGVMMSCVITLPAFGAIIVGRAGGAKSDHTNLLSLFIPELTSKNIGFSAYSFGLPAILILALVVFILYEKKKSIKFLAISVLAFASFPILRYVLNGTLYTREKALIPFVPLAILIIVRFANYLSKNKYSIKQCVISGIIISMILIVDWKAGIGNANSLRVVLDMVALLGFIGVDKLIRRKIGDFKYKLVYIYSALFALGGCIVINYSEALVKIKDANKYFNQEKYQVIEDTLNADDEVYRFTDLCNTKFTNNHFWGKKYLSVGCYSSVINQNYMEFCNYDLGINNPTVNDITVVPPSDVMFNMFMGIRYTVDDNWGPIGYDYYKKNGKYTVAKNDKAYSLGFATDKVMTTEEFNKLSPEDREVVLLQAIVADEENICDNAQKLEYISEFERVNIDTSLGLKKDSDGYYHINTKKKEKKYTIDIPDSLHEYVYVIKCRIKEYTAKRAAIRVNGMQNCLSGSESAFPNKNFDFKFVASSNVEKRKLDILFTKGSDFKFSELELYRINYDDIAKYYDDMVMMEDVKIDGNNNLSGRINIDKDCMFTTTIPYDMGFKVYVDGKKTDYFKTNKAFIGMKLPKGEHNIEMKYTAPLAREGKIISIIGLVILLVVGSKGIVFASKKNVDK